MQRNCVLLAENKTTGKEISVYNSHDYDREERWQANMWMGFFTKWWVILIIVACGFAIGAWAFNVATSGVKGQGDAQIEKNSAQNWTQAQAWFHDQYEGIKAADKTVTIAYEALQLDLKDKTLQQNYTGAQQVCVKMVSAYNAEAQKYLKKDFRDASLPERINENDSDTNCKEN